MAKARRQRSAGSGAASDPERTSDRDALAGATGLPLRGLDGKVLRVYRESSGVWTWVQDYVYRKGTRSGRVDCCGRGAGVALRGSYTYGGVGGRASAQQRGCR